MRAALTSCLFVLSCVGCERSSAPVPGHGVKFPDAVASIANKTVAEDYSYRDAVGKLQELEKKTAERKASALPAQTMLKSELCGGERYELEL
ncbi:hypothetical protein LCGC14_2589510 [marine sediment metagenome]|uniref:Uncharacterized protein n=1 Tax=marine sediment metagenome TaxID=412755 RepID=A0A0F9ABZ5_9ZZZZ